MLWNSSLLVTRDQITSLIMAGHEWGKFFYMIYRIRRRTSLLLEVILRKLHTVLKNNHLKQWIRHWLSIPYSKVIDPQRTLWKLAVYQLPYEKLRSQRGWICAQVHSSYSKLKMINQEAEICLQVKGTTKVIDDPRRKFYLMCLLCQWLILRLKGSLERLLHGWSWRNHGLSHGRKWRCRKKAKSWHLSIRRKWNLLFFKKIVWVGFK